MFMRDRWKIRGGGRGAWRRSLCVGRGGTMEGGGAREGPWGMIDLQF